MRHTAEGHPDEGTLQAWLDHPRSGMPPEEVAAVEAHLSACEVCSTRVAALGEESSRAAELLGATPAAAPPPFAAIEARARRIDADDDAPSPAADRAGGHTTGVPVRRWRAGAWAASIAVALGTGWMANEIIRTDASAREGFREESVSAPAPPPEIEVSAPPRDGAAGGDRAPTAQDAGNAVPGPQATGDRMPPPQATGDRASRTPGPPPVATTRAARGSSLPAEPALAAETVVRGRVVDAASGRPLESVQVFESATGRGTVTDSTGAFALTLPTDLVSGADSALTLRTRRIGYGESDRRVAPTADTAIVLADLELESTAVSLQELVESSGADAAAVRLPFSVGSDSVASRLREGAALPHVERRPVPTVVGPEIEWTPMEPGQAREELGSALRSVPELSVSEVGLGRVEGRAMVRVIQPLPGGGVLSVYQARWPFRFVEAAGGDRALDALVDGIWVAVTAPGSATLVEEWLARVR